MDGLNAFFEKFSAYHDETKQNFGEVKARLIELEQKAVGGFGGGRLEHKSAGEQVTENDGFKAFIRNGGIGSVRVKTITSASGSGEALVAADRRPGIVPLAQTRLTVRDLFVPVPTISNLVEVPQEASFTNNAATVAEGATKPTSDATFDVLSVQVRTVAHILNASRQILDDVPQLQAFINTKMTYGLDIVEELQLLLGAGTGTDIHGLVPQATAYNTSLNVSGDTKVDTILHAITQVETASQFPVTGIVLNASDWSSMLGIKTDDSDYLSNGPFGTTTRPMLWGKPVVPTVSMTAGKFLVGNFQQAATLYDRMETEILISSEHSDFFAKNLIAIRAEKRIALAVSAPWALIQGNYPT